MIKYLFISFFLVTSLFSKEIVIATGSKSGNYYKVGKQLNKTWYKGKAKVINTQGSVENLLLLADNKADIALAQGDALEFLDIFYSSTGQSSDDFIKIISELYMETLHIIVNKNSNIKTIDDLNGKTIVTGGKKSGTSVTVGFIKNNFDLEFGSILDISTKKGLDLLKKNRVDAVFYVSRAPSNLLLKYKNDIRLLSVNKPLDNNKHIQVVNLPNSIYSFMDADISTYGINSYIVAAKSLKEKKKKTYVEAPERLINIPTDVLKKYNAKYGNYALHKVMSYNVKLEELKNEKTLIKLVSVNNLINSNKYLKDRRQWKKGDYWSKPLEFLGTGYGDSEEFALMKYLFLVKLGVEPSKFKFLELKRDIQLRNDKPDKKNIVLAYYHNEESPAVILSNKITSKKVFLLKEEDKFKEIKVAKNRIYKKLFADDFSQEDVNSIISRF